MTSTENQVPWVERFFSRWMPGVAAGRAESRARMAAFEAREAATRQFASSYRGAVSTRLDTPWPMSRSGIGLKDLDRQAQQQLRDRSRELERRNPIASGLLDRACDNVVGQGFHLQARTKDDAFNEAAEDLWQDWWESPEVTGSMSGVELTRMAYRSRQRDGDVGLILAEVAGVPKLQLIEGDLIDDLLPSGFDTSARVHGIDLGPYGRPTAFHILTLNGEGKRTDTAVAAKDFIFLPRTKRASEIRGEPVFASVLPIFDQIDGYVEATVVAARIAACQGLIIKTNNSAQAFGGLGSGTNSQGNAQAIATMEPGMVRYLKPGEEVQTLNPMQPTQSFPDFLACLLRFTGLNLGMPLELVFMDFSRTNYSSARGALLQAYRSFMVEQQFLIDRFFKRVYRWRISKAVKNGELTVPASIAGDYWHHEWIAPRWQWLDPSKEIAAAFLEVDLGLNTLTNFAKQHGREWDETMATRKKELDKMREFGVPIVHSAQTRDPTTSTNPQIVSPAGSPPNPVKAPEDGEDDASTDEG